MDSVKQYAPLIGRILIAQIFILAGISKIGGFAGTAGWMASKGLPMVNVLLVLTIIIEVGGGLMILLGWRARIAAAVLFLWMIPVTFIFHNFWAAPEAQKLTQMIMFQKNLALMGTMCLLYAFGSGRYSLADK